MDALRQLGEEYWDFVMEGEPVWATMLGDHRFNDRLPDLSAARRDQDARKVRGFLARLDAIHPESDQDRISADVLRLNCENWLAEVTHGFWQWSTLEPLNGPHVWLLELLNYHPTKTEKDLADLTARYRAFARLIADLLTAMREGVQQGRTLPKVIVERLKGQLDGIVATPPETSPLRPPDFPVEVIADAVYGGMRELRRFLDDYPGRDSVGLSALPGGQDAYAHRIRMHTTTTLSAQEIHDYGQEMVQQLTTQMRQVAREVGHDGDLASFRDWLRSNPANFFASREEVADNARNWLERLKPMLPQYFGRLPQASCIVKSIEDYREKDCVAAFYYPPSADFSRPGTYYINTYQPETRPRHNMAALAVHEAVPGHHLQIALAMELGELPKFRRHGMFTAFIEGWGLYSERLGVEMGVYADPLARFGMLTYQAWRAARLVVDTGMHALGWSRAQAIEFFQTYVGLPQGEIENEIDRYIVWPGQALAYTIGMREILDLRRGAEARLGARFDVRAFHDELLRFGALPLSTLRQLLEGWLERQIATV